MEWIEVRKIEVRKIEVRKIEVRKIEVSGVLVEIFGNVFAHCVY